MTRPILIGLRAIILIGVPLLLCCSDPLKSSNQSSAPTGPGRVDTVVIIDTVVLIDSTIRIDTVIIIGPNPGGPQLLCSEIESNRKEIVWMLRNPAGRYRLEFQASTERNNPEQSLTVTIDDHEFVWAVGQNPEFITDLLLGEHSTVQIVSNEPPACGHEIDICLTVRPL